MSTSAHICIIDDDAELSGLLRKRLSDYGFAVSHFSHGEAFFAADDRPLFDLIILDVMLPGEDGLSICRRLREVGSPWADVPILFLSALGESVDRVIGLEVGGDDYLAKPFETRELIARVKALLRRATRKVQWVTAENPSFAGWTLDLLSRQLIDSEGVVVPLSSGEFRLLSLFLEHPQRVLSRERIMELSALKGGGIYDRSIDTQIKRLRGKLRDDGRKPSIIVTMRGDGYMLACDVTRTS
ncbi:MAG: response regulator [Mailhella sp.]|nr:response regulator [Mailhella sp.]